MKQTIRFIIVIYAIVYITLGILSYTDVIDSLFLNSAIIAGILNLVNSLIALFLFEYSHKKGNKVFLIANVGGMGVRMLLMLTSILIVIKFLKIHEIGFLLIFFVIYFILLSSEVFYFHKKIKNKIFER